MEEKELNRLDKEILLSLLEYCKYLYEEEKERTSRIEKKIDIFSAFLGGGVLVSLILPSAKLQLLFDGNIMIHPLRLFVAASYFLSFLAFFISFLFIVRIYTVQKFERPTDPHTIVSKAMRVEDISDFLSTKVADYSIATTRNHDINDKKAKHFSKALFFFLIGVLFSVVSIAVFNASTLFNGGK